MRLDHWTIKNITQGTVEISLSREPLMPGGVFPVDGELPEDVRYNVGRKWLTATLNYKGTMPAPDPRPRRPDGPRPEKFKKKSLEKTEKQEDETTVD